MLASCSGEATERSTTEPAAGESALAEAAALEQRVRDHHAATGEFLQNSNDVEDAGLRPDDAYDVPQFLWDPTVHRICVVHTETGAWGLVGGDDDGTFENSGDSEAECDPG